MHIYSYPACRALLSSSRGNIYRQKDVTFLGLHLFAALMMMLSLLVSTASGQKMIPAVRGEDVLLPCIESQPDKLQPSATFIWRDKDDLYVYDIVRNKQDVSDQHSRFRNRTHSFPLLYSQGNFSIVLKKVRLTDSGTYTCYIPSRDKEHKVQLKVTDKPVTTVTPMVPTQGRDSGGRSGGSSVGVNPLSLPLILLLGKTVL